MLPETLATLVPAFTVAATLVPMLATLVPLVAVATVLVGLGVGDWYRVRQSRRFRVVFYPRKARR